jgi:hypothetical protein
MSRKFDFEFVSFTFDQLKEMSTDQLKLNMIKFKRMIKEARNQGKDTIPFEVEFSYLENERQLRNKFDNNSRIGAR